METLSKWSLHAQEDDESTLRCLGIESTAHTFSCAIIEKRGSTNRILSDIRDVYVPPAGSGIHPREASRHHAAVSTDVLRKCLCESSTDVCDLDMISYAGGPGLGPCLRVGAVVARALSSYHDIPIYPVHHAIGHIELGKMLTAMKDPLVLLVSGGHTMLLAFSNMRWRVFGETLDITLGQLIDQFGRSLGMASPCGTRIEKIARQSSKYHELPYTVKGNDVSFSGLYSATKQLITTNSATAPAACNSLQETAFAMICEATERALALTQKRELLIVGGVAANARLNSMLSQMSKRHKCKMLATPIQYAGDCGSQIAWAAILQAGATRPAQLNQTFIRQSWRLDTVDINY